MNRQTRPLPHRQHVVLRQLAGANFVRINSSKLARSPRTILLTPKALSSIRCRALPAVSFKASKLLLPEPCVVEQPGRLALRGRKPVLLLSRDKFERTLSNRDVSQELQQDVWCFQQQALPGMTPNTCLKSALGLGCSLYWASLRL